jgi:hypothetical protein
MSEFNLRDYVYLKANKLGLRIHVEHPSLGPHVYVMSKNKDRRHAAALSISGIEQLQNANPAQMKDLIDSRFENLLFMLDGFIPSKESV